MLLSFREQQFPGRQKSKCVRQSLFQPSQSNLFLCLSAVSDPHTSPLQCLVSIACALLWMYRKQGKMQSSLVFKIQKKHKRVIFQIAIDFHGKLPCTHCQYEDVWATDVTPSHWLTPWNFKCFFNHPAVTAFSLSTCKKRCRPVVKSIWTQH